MNRTITAALVCLTGHTFAQCNCDHTLTGLSSTSVNIINASSFSYAPGDTFCINADTIAGLRLTGFNGSLSQPLVFINCGGEVVIQENTYSGIAFQESNYVQITGTGDSSVPYGFHIIKSGNGQMGVALGKFSSDFEVDHVEIENTGFAGIMAKTDPNCSDSSTWRSSGYIFKNLEIHHNYIHHTGGEGMYIGYTGGYKVESNLVCNGEYVFGHWLENVDVHHNLLVNTGWDAIQLNLVRSGGKIHDNRIINHGQEGVTYQDFAMSIGGGTYEIYNNYVLVDWGNFGKGMQMISGQSGSKLYNNVFINTYSYAIFAHNRHEFEDTTEGYYFINNTIVNPERSGILLNTGITLSEDTALIGNQQNQVPSYFINNFIADPGSDHASGNTWKGEQESFIDFNTKSTRDAQLVRIFSNLLTRQPDTLLLIDTLLNNYAPGASSPLVNTGFDVSAYGVAYDFNNVPRPQLGFFDIGAYEYSTQTSITQPRHSKIIAYPNPVNGQLFVTGCGANESYSLYNSSGRRVMSGRLNGTIAFTDLPAGLYVLVLENAGESIVIMHR